LAQERESPTTADKKTLEGETSSQSVRLIRAENLARTFPNLSICILQGTLGSGGGGSTRSESDRRQAISLRLFAAEVFAQGIPVVIVIPSLKPSVAIAVLKKLAGFIGSNRPNGTRRLMKTLDDARTEILGKGGKSKNREVLWELALDVSLYAVPDWSGRLALSAMNRVTTDQERMQSVSDETLTSSGTKL
jgi:hypothetical protein